MSSTAVELHSPTGALAIRPGQEMFTEKQKAALAVLGIKGASSADLAVFMHYCQKTGLDPFSRQVYGIMRREKQGEQWVDKFTIQTGIDGFRVIRDRVAARLGVTVEYEDTVWYDPDGNAHTVWLWDEPPAACKVTVVRDGRRFPAVVRTASYIQRNKNGDAVSQWRTQPDHMIEKCAEAFALRRAFPHDLGGLYIDEEMPAQPATVHAVIQSDRVTAADITGPAAPAAPQADTAPAPASPAPRPAAKAALERLERLSEQIVGTWPEHDVTAMFERITGAEWAATGTQVKDVASVLDDALAAAQGDPEAASASLWRQFHPDGE